MSVMPAEASGTKSKYDRLIAAAQKVPPVPTLVVHPCDESLLRGAVDAAEAGIIKPILVGPAAKIRDIAAKHGMNISSYEIVDTPAIAKYRVHREAAARADQRGVNVELTEIEIVILRGFADSTLNPLSTSREASRTTT